MRLEPHKLKIVQVFMACMLWGTGTALGEIPPYALSRAAQLAGEADEEFEDIMNAKPTSSWDVVTRMKVFSASYLLSVLLPILPRALS